MTAPLLEGKVALVSGVGGGLGRATCLALAAHGARIVAGDIADESVEATVAAVRGMGGEATGLPTDVRNAASCTVLAHHAEETFGGIDVLVNNAYDGGDFQLFESADLSRWKATAEVNLWGSLQMTQAALEQLKRSTSGRVVMICAYATCWAKNVLSCSKARRSSSDRSGGGGSPRLTAALIAAGAVPGMLEWIPASSGGAWMPID